MNDFFENFAQYAEKTNGSVIDRLGTGSIFAIFHELEKYESRIFSIISRYNRFVQLFWGEDSSVSLLRCYLARGLWSLRGSLLCS